MKVAEFESSSPRDTVAAGVDVASLPFFPLFKLFNGVAFRQAR